MNDNTRLLYVGWTGQSNLGDDAIADALLPRLPGVEHWHVPHEPRAFARRVVAGGLSGARERAVLVGGGTVVGRRNWRLLLAATGALLAWRRPWHLIGIGVEDPEFQGRNSFSAGGELARWREVCARFDRVTVRGPRSAELLESVGVSAEMAGDPALLHEPEIRAPQDKLLAVNLGFGDDLWGHDHDRVVEAVAGLVRGLSADGWSARFVVINPKDRVFAERALCLAGVTGEIRAAYTVADYFAAVGDCTALVAERLHALVLAAAAGVPMVGLEYQPKCADFLASVGAQEHCVRTDRVTAPVLREHVDAVAGGREAESARLLGEVAALRTRLQAELARITAGSELTGSRR